MPKGPLGVTNARCRINGPSVTLEIGLECSAHARLVVNYQH
jgi:hypothetical protein